MAIEQQQLRCRRGVGLLKAVGDHMLHACGGHVSARFYMVAACTYHINALRSSTVGNVIAVSCLTLDLPFHIAHLKPPVPTVPLAVSGYTF